ncbi:hypothetical protein MSG28_004676 [Choristoneura fumiferana]|uniref:Uncharacterized protein n=1 Tax=Choristoneura fumiferana TaxID=7141 RepID=A0ACC0K7L6_CHOFU|nr:hypothetical protein MSG28_004676 [Choristoneura fumiferana]
MRSQTSKTVSKKGVVSRPTFKARTNTKPVKKKNVTPKKGKNVVAKPVSKNAKKSTEDIVNKKDEAEASNSDKNDTAEVAKAGTSKANTSRSNSPSKKIKKDPKEKKIAPKAVVISNIKKVLAKKSPKKPKVTSKSKLNHSMDGDDGENIKYKINSGVPKKILQKQNKSKIILKKTSPIQKKKSLASTKPGDSENKPKNDSEDYKNDATDNKDSENTENKLKDTPCVGEKEDEDKSIDKTDDKDSVCNTSSASITSNVSGTNLTETSPKIENERPPKFFTSSRPPRTVDIDVKCCKNSKGNLSVSERFISMKCETKTEENNKEKSTLNTLVSAGPEIDVYTFTEKVDSPKSILSGFRSPVNKNVGRVRPIARVKGTIIDKKTEVEKKKYSPHRPIEEVVKQLKAKKGSEEISTTPIDAASSITMTPIDSSDKDLEEKPKPIVSKSYKMVARKSSITGKPFSPIKFLDQDPTANRSEKEKVSKNIANLKKAVKSKKQQKKSSLSDEDINTSKFAFNTKSFHYATSDESHSESNDDNDTKESSESDSPKSKKTKTKKYKRITDGAKKPPSKELKELSKDSLIDLKDESILIGNEKPSKRRLKLLSMWSGPKKHRMASLNAIAKVHCLYENESRTHMELGLMKTIDRPVLPSTSKVATVKKKEPKAKEMNQVETTSESEYDSKKDTKKEDSSESSDDNPPQRSLRGVPGIRSAGKYWDPKSSTSSSEDSELDSKKKTVNIDKKKTSPKASTSKSDLEKPPAKMKKTAGVPVKKKRNRNEVVMDLKDMVVQKRMASLNATAILAASYEKRSPKSSKDDTTSDSCSDESFSHKPKNGAGSGVKSEVKNDEPKKEKDETPTKDKKQKVEVIVNQDTDVTITGVYSTHHHEGFCTVSGMQYRISSTSHTQTTATANCDKESCSRDDEARYTPLSALSSMQPPVEHQHSHPHPVMI